jgi:Na+(H+)/acetate symporter ActP
VGGSLCFVLCALCFVLCALCFVLCALCFVLCALLSAPWHEKARRGAVAGGLGEIWVAAGWSGNDPLISAPDKAIFRGWALGVW